MAKVKYMGTAHRAVLEAGEDFNGRLATPIPNEVVWDFDENRHLVDSDEVGLSAEAVSLLLETEGDRFQDVSGQEVYPASLHENIFRGAPGGPESIPSPPELEGTPNPESTGTQDASATGAGAADAGARGGTAGGRARGGSTAAGGDAGAGGAGAAPTGGNTAT